MIPHGLWKLGRIQELLAGRDNQPRAAVVRVASRDRQHVLLRRPLQLLYPLELREADMPESTSGAEPASSPDVHISNPVGESGAPTPEIPERRPIRAAARRATEKMGAWTQELLQD